MTNTKRAIIPIEANMPPLFGLLAILSAFITAVFLTPQPLLLELPQNSSRVLSASKWTIRDVVFGVSLPELQTEGDLRTLFIHVT